MDQYQDSACFLEEVRSAARSPSLDFSRELAGPSRSTNINAVDEAELIRIRNDLAHFFQLDTLVNAILESAELSEDFRKTVYSIIDRAKIARGHPKFNAGLIPSSPNISRSNSSGFPFLSDRSRQPQFNELFQRTLDSVSDSSLWEDAQQFESLSSLARDFMYAAVHYGKTIISEKNLQISRKTIPPCTEEVGGVAGGEKYVKAGILFKFAINTPENVYSEDEFAAKAAGHELKGAVGLFNSQQAGHGALRFPLVILIDHLGYRLVAMSLLPIDSMHKSTLLYGSPDAGRTVMSSPEVHGLMKGAAQILNLKLHRAGAKDGQSEELYMPCDIEVHRGYDGRLYCLDLARLFPPEPPQGIFPAEHLTRLLRPELIRKCPSPLSSDAFTRFSHCDPKAPEHEKEIREAVKLLHQEVIPQFAADFLVKSLRTDFTQDQFISLLHQAGINVRHIGGVYAQLESLLKTEITFQDAAEVIFRDVAVELAARAMSAVFFEGYLEILAAASKNVQSKPCSRDKKNKNPQEPVYLHKPKVRNESLTRERVSKLINGLFGDSVDSLKLREERVVPCIRRLYTDVLSKEDCERVVDMVTVENFPTLFMRTTVLVNIMVADKCLEQLKINGSAFFSGNETVTIPEDFSDVLALDHLKESDVMRYYRPPALDERKLQDVVLSRFAAITQGSAKPHRMEFPILQGTAFDPACDLPNLLAVKPWVRNNVQKLQRKLTALISTLQKKILIEAAARCVKNWIRKAWREQVQGLDWPAIEPYRRIAVDCLNTVFGNTESSKHFRGELLVREMQRRFPHCMGREEERVDRTALFEDGDFLLRLLRRVEKLSGIRLSPDCEELIQDIGFSFLRRVTFPFEDTDIMGIGEIVKQMPLLEYAQATSIFIQALQRPGKEKLQLAQRAEKSFQRALSINNLDYMTLCNWGYLACAVEQDVVKGVQLYSQALAINPAHPRSLYYLAILFQRSKSRIELFRARRLLEKAVELSPRNVSMLKDLANMLWREYQERELAEQFYIRALEENPTHGKTLAGYGAFIHAGLDKRPDLHVSGWYTMKACEADRQNLRFVNGLLNYLRQVKSGHHSQKYFETAKSAADMLVRAARENYSERLSRNDRDFRGLCRATAMSVAKAARHALAVKQPELAAELFKAVECQTELSLWEPLLMYISYLTRVKRDYVTAEKIYLSAAESRKTTPGSGRKTGGGAGPSHSKFSSYIAHTYRDNLRVLTDILRGLMVAKQKEDNMLEQLEPLTRRVLSLLRSAPKTGYSAGRSSYGSSTSSAAGSKASANGTKKGGNNNNGGRTASEGGDMDQEDDSIEPEFDDDSTETGSIISSTSSSGDRDGGAGTSSKVTHTYIEALYLVSRIARLMMRIDYKPKEAEEYFAVVMSQTRPAVMSKGVQEYIDYLEEDERDVARGKKLREAFERYKILFEQMQRAGNNGGPANGRQLSLLDVLQEK